MRVWEERQGFVTVLVDFFFFSALFVLIWNIFLINMKEPIG